MGPINFLIQEEIQDVISGNVYPQRIDDSLVLIQIEMVGAGTDTTGTVTLQGRVSENAPWVDIDSWDDGDMVDDTIIEQEIKYNAMRVVLTSIAGSDPVVSVWLEY